MPSRSTHHLALPAAPARGAVLLLHSWWGLTDGVRRLGDRFADAGFAALAPDLYDGRTAHTVADAEALRREAMRARREPAYRYLTRMVDELRAAARTERVAVVGCSMGGHWAFWLAARPDLPIAATVVFYAARGGDYAASRSAFQLHLAEHDDWVSPASVRGCERALARAGRPVERWDYPGTGHWFFEEDRTDAFDAEAAALAWTRTVGFIQRTLGHGAAAGR